jgi:hypothetical protein
MRKRAALFIGGAIALVVFLCVGAAALFLYVSRSFCSEEQRSRLTSSDGKYIAIVYFRHCGFAAESYVHVNVFRSDEKPRGQLVSGRITKGMVFAVYGMHQINVDWVGPRAIAIDCPGCQVPHNGVTDVFQQQTSVNDISVTFQPAMGQR